MEYFLWILAITAFLGLVKALMPIIIRNVRLEGFFGARHPENEKRLQNSYLHKQLSVFADAIKNVAGNMMDGLKYSAEPDDVDISTLFNDISMKMCEKCDSCARCWETDFDSSYKSACEILEYARSNGSVTADKVPEEFRERCSCVSDYINEVNDNFNYLRNESMWHSRAAEIKNAAARQLVEVAGQMMEIADCCDTGRYQAEQQKLLRRLMDDQIKARSISVSEDGGDRLRIAFYAKSLNGRSIGAKKLLKHFESVFGKRFAIDGGARKIIGSDYAEYTFCEDLNFRVLTGAARAPRNEAETSGDNFSFYEMKNGNLMMLLADGMGTGEKAAGESKIVVEMMEELLEAGFGEISAMKIVNSTMMMRNDNFIFSTFDMGVINLFSGVLEIFKAGAAATFIKRRDRVEVIRSTSLPIGMINENAFDISRKKLYHGDYVIMLSDGVIDCIDSENKEEFLYDIILRINTKKPEEMAEDIIKEIRAQESFKPIDDMTVMVTGVWQKMS